jgi:hypothetical protein
MVIPFSDAHMHPSIPFTANQPAVMQEKLYNLDELFERALPSLETSLIPLYLCITALFASLGKFLLLCAFCFFLDLY